MVPEQIRAGRESAFCPLHALSPTLLTPISGYTAYLYGILINVHQTILYSLKLYDTYSKIIQGNLIL